jgi:hypothetical protein
MKGMLAHGSTSLASHASPATQRKQTTLTAPPLLLELPPLAAMTNCYMQAWNALRVLPMVSLYLPVAELLADSLQRICMALIQYELDEKDAKTHHSVCTVFNDIWIPYILRTFFEGVYGGLNGCKVQWDRSDLNYAHLLDRFQSRIREVLPHPTTAETATAQ